MHARIGACHYDGNCDSSDLWMRRKPWLRSLGAWSCSGLQCRAKAASGSDLLLSCSGSAAGSKAIRILEPRVPSSEMRKECY